MKLPAKVMVTGKGGGGKSTVVTLIARRALKEGRQVIVVDADESNPAIGRMLGLSDSGAGVIDTVGGRTHVFGSIKDAPSEELQKTVISLVEQARDKDLTVVQVGKIREAGSGCACPHGVIAREVLSYPFKSGTLVVVDAEAGVEHFGRGIDSKADLIIFVVDPSYDSIKLCEEAKRLADSIHVDFLAVLNKVDSDEVACFMKEQLSKRGIDVEAVIPYDTDVLKSTMLGKPLQAGTAAASLDRLMNRILGQ